jgi:hypothetical protein
MVEMKLPEPEFRQVELGQAMVRVGEPAPVRHADAFSDGLVKSGSERTMRLDYRS